MTTIEEVAIRHADLINGFNELFKLLASANYMRRDRMFFAPHTDPAINTQAYVDQGFTAEVAN
jgi:hypothetical protein